MSKALVLVMRDGRAIKWAGKYHNILAEVSPENGRVLKFLPAMIWRDIRNGTFYIEVSREFIASNNFKSQREALEWIANVGLVNASGGIIVGGHGVEGKEFAEDLLHKHQQACTLLAA
ncbi:hypothetical protein [Hyphomicrobium sp. ghe19]|uniref:hypothetical protein n=1 Tax=Hyphomicrobium sp. ghe19 TaxID=2682968 RepID=UPI00136794D3|nr:hypothetical protein HYPP_02651 [Hyphomicrobium sp. ghe19]